MGPKSPALASGFLTTDPARKSWASLVAQLVRNPPTMQKIWVQSRAWRSPEEGEHYQFQYSGLENSMDWIVHGVAKSWHDWVTFTLLCVHALHTCLHTCLNLFQAFFIFILIYLSIPESIPHFECAWHLLTIFGMVLIIFGCLTPGELLVFPYSTTVLIL